MRFGNAEQAMKDFLTNKEIKNFRTSKIGDLAEDYVKELLKPFHCEKINEKINPAKPDFYLKINGKSCYIENKCIEEIYPEPIELIRDILKKVNKEKLIEQFNFSIEPLNIHSKDIKQVKNKLKKKWESKINEEDFCINCEGGKSYLFSIKKRTKILGGMSGTFSGGIMRNNSNIDNTINRSKRQIRDSDFLSCVIINNLITKENLRTYFYPLCQIQIKMDSEDSISKYISQYSYLFWDKFPNLKGIICIFPTEKEITIFPSLKYFNDFSCGEYYLLTKCFEDQKFKVNILSHSNKIVNMSEEKGEK